MFKGVIFDCDGVLFESTAANLAFYNAVLRHFNAPEVKVTDAAQVRLCHTAASPTVLKTLLGPEKGSEALAYAGEMAYDDFIPHMKPEIGMVEALQQLSGHYRLGVATNRGASIQPILSYYQIRSYFLSVHCCLDVDAPKPAPDMLLLSAKQLGCKVDQLLFVGDSHLDKQAAAAAGMAFAAFKSEEEGDYSVSSYDELLVLLSPSG